MNDNPEPWWCGKCSKYHAPGECDKRSELQLKKRSESLDVADCCTTLEEARDVIRRRESYACSFASWIKERTSAGDQITPEMILTRLVPLCGS